jgi:thiol-disulfide isomerase/thioredoxin
MTAVPTSSVPSRRDIVRSGLIGTAAWVAGTAAIAQQRTIPFLEFGRKQFTIIQPEREVPSIRLFRLQGGTTDLSSLRGKPILLNFWATWCAACRTELPIFERQLRSAWRDSLHVVAVSEDRDTRQAVERFVTSHDLKSLPVYLDPNGYVGTFGGDNGKNAPFLLYGMPITYLISASGLIIGYMPGEADWSSDAASDLIEYLRQS